MDPGLLKTKSDFFAFLSGGLGVKLDSVTISCVGLVRRESDNADGGFGIKPVELSISGRTSFLPR